MCTLINGEEGEGKRSQTLPSQSAVSQLCLSLLVRNGSWRLSIGNMWTAKGTGCSLTVGPTPLQTQWFTISSFLLLTTEQLQYTSPLPCWQWQSVFTHSLVSKCRSESDKSHQDAPFSQWRQHVWEQLWKMAQLGSGRLGEARTQHHKTSDSQQIRVAHKQPGSA